MKKNMFRITIFFLVAMTMWIVMAIPAAAESKTVKDDIIEITFSNVLRVETKTAPFSEGNTIVEKTIDVFVLPANGSEITFKYADSSQQLIMVHVWKFRDGAFDTPFDELAYDSFSPIAAIKDSTNELRCLKPFGKSEIMVYFANEPDFLKCFQSDNTNNTPATTGNASGNSVTVNVGGSNVIWTDAAPFINSDGRTMVPLRAVGDALGLTVSWDNSKKEAVFTDGNKTIYFPIGSTIARTSEGSTVAMDTAAVIAGDRTYAPIRYLAEYFGYSVGWDNASKTVSIVNGNEGTTTPTTTTPTTTTDPYDFSSYDWHNGLVAGPYDAERERQAEIMVNLAGPWVSYYKSQTGQALVMWGFINAYGNHLESAIQNNKSYGHIDSEIDKNGRSLKALALDVLWRYYAEQNGWADVGRILPKRYISCSISFRQERSEFKDIDSYSFTLADVTNSPYSS